MSAGVVEAVPEVITIAEAARLMRRNRDQVARLMRRGVVGTQKYPGGRPMLIRADVDRLIAESIRPASK